MNDADLVAAALRGNESAFTCLVERHEKWLLRYIQRYVRNRTDACDVLQESLIAAWRGLRSYDQSRPLEFWLRRIALNKCRDRARRLAVRRIFLPMEGLPNESRVPDPAPLADVFLAESQQLGQLRDAINKLPASLRDALILVTLEGLSHADAATILGLTAKAVEGAVYRAKKRLIEKLR